YGPRPDAAHVDEVDTEIGDARLPLGGGVERRLGGAPVVAVVPMGDQLAQVRQVRPVRPARVGDLVGEARAGKALAQVREHRVGDVDEEGLDVHAGASRVLPTDG